MLFRSGLSALLALLVLALPSHALDAAGQARELFQRGQHALAAGKSQDAIDAFEAAYAADKAPSLLFYLGEAYRLAGDRAKAIQEYQLYLEKLPDAPKKADAEAKIAELKKGPAPSSGAKHKVALEELAVGANQAPPKHKVTLDDLEVGANKEAPKPAAGPAKKVALGDLELSGNGKKADAPAKGGKVVLDTMPFETVAPEMPLVALTPEKAKLVAPPAVAHVDTNAKSAKAERRERQAQHGPALPAESLELVIPSLAAKSAPVAAAEPQTTTPPAAAPASAPTPTPVASPAPTIAPAPVAATIVPVPAAPGSGVVAPVPHGYVAPTVAVVPRITAPIEVVAPPAMPTLRLTGIVVGSIGAAALIGGGICGFGAMTAANDINTAAQQGKVYDPSVESRGKRDQAAEIGLMAGGGAALAGGVLLYLFNPPSAGAHASNANDSSRATASVIPVRGGMAASTAVRF